MRPISTELPDVLLIALEVHADARGTFIETYRRDRASRIGIDVELVQDNVARSRRGVLRGLHFQRRPGQDKLVRVTRGRIFEVAVDIRPGSPTFRSHVAREIDAADAMLLYVPRGFAHGYQALEDDTEVAYKVSSPYDPAEEIAIAWDDPELAIAWPIVPPIVSPRDGAAPRLREVVDGLSASR